MGRAALFFVAIGGAFAGGYATRAREGGTNVAMPVLSQDHRHQSCADDCEQTAIVGQAGPEGIASCVARCPKSASAPVPPRETPRSITVAPADHRRSTPQGR